MLTLEQVGANNLEIKDLSKKMIRKQQSKTDLFLNAMLWLIILIGSLAVVGMILQGIFKLGTLGVHMIGDAERRRAIAECEQWKAEAQVYPGYYMTNWQTAQCDTYEITIDIPPRNEEQINFTRN